jgi:hypothetical protein
VENLVKPPNQSLSPHLCDSMAEINPIFLPFYPLQLDIMDIEVEKC